MQVRYTQKNSFKTLCQMNQFILPAQSLDVMKSEDGWSKIDFSAVATDFNFNFYLHLSQTKAYRLGYKSEVHLNCAAL